MLERMQISKSKPDRGEAEMMNPEIWRVAKGKTFPCHESMTARSATNLKQPQATAIQLKFSHTPDGPPTGHGDNGGYGMKYVSKYYTFRQESLIGRLCNTLILRIHVSLRNFGV
jgi:hypothetical protein